MPVLQKLRGGLGRAGKAATAGAIRASNTAKVVSSTAKRAAGEFQSTEKLLTAAERKATVLRRQRDMQSRSLGAVQTTLKSARANLKIADRRFKDAWKRHDKVFKAAKDPVARARADTMYLDVKDKVRQLEDADRAVKYLEGREKAAQGHVATANTGLSNVQAEIRGLRTKLAIQRQRMNKPRAKTSASTKRSTSPRKRMKSRKKS